MAFPAVAGTIATTNIGTAATSHTVNLPSGIQAGETIILLWRTTSASGNTGLPAGDWTTIVDSALTDRVGIAWRKASGTEGSTITVTTVGSTKFAALCFRVSGAADPTVTPPQISTVATGTSTTPDPTTATPTGGAKDYLWIWFGSWQGEQTSPPSGNPTNYGSNKAGADTGTAGTTATNSRVAMATRELNAASEDPGSWTISASDAWAAYTIAVHPATLSAVDGPVLDLVWDVRNSVDGPVLDVVWDTRAQADGPVLDLVWDLIAQVNGPVLDVVWDLNNDIIARHFDGDDIIQFGIGNANITGDVTVAGLVRMRSANPVYILSNYTSGGTPAMTLGINASGQVLYLPGNRTSTTTISPSDGWVLIVVTKDAGTATPRAHIYKNGSWTHEDMSGTASNPSSQAGGSIRTEFFGVPTGAVDMAMAAEWTSKLTEGQIESLMDGDEARDWAALSPAAGFRYHQTSTTEDVLDWTGGGANQTSLTGTSVIESGPEDWDYLVPVNGGALDLLWDLIAQVNSDPLELIWDTRSQADGPALDLVWDLHGAVDGVPLDLVWDLVAQVNGVPLDLLWDLRSQADADALDLVWDLRSQADADALDIRWDLYGAVDADALELIWDLIAQVNAPELALKWDLYAAVDADPLELIWDLLAAAGEVNAAPLRLVWDTVAEVDGPPLDLLWDLRSAVDGAVLDLLWDLRAQADADALDLVWDLRAAVDSATLELIWDTHTEVNSAPLDLLWDLRAEVNAPVLDLIWDLLTEGVSPQHSGFLNGLVVLAILNGVIQRLDIRHGVVDEPGVTGGSPDTLTGAVIAEPNRGGEPIERVPTGGVVDEGLSG